MLSAHFAQAKMIKLTRLNRVPLILNSDLIEHIAVTPDTVITLISGQKFMVLESAEEIVEKVIAFRRLILGKDPASLFAGNVAGTAQEILSHGE
jgi:flagellar protein FlbD